MVEFSFKKNMMIHEIIGAILIFIGVSWLGVGLYYTISVAIDSNAGFLLWGSTAIWAIFPLFYGLGALLVMFGIIELRELLPGKNRRN